MGNNEMGLAKLKEIYGELQKKYGWPSFKEMNEDFHIEKIAENETEIPVREIRRYVGDKLVNYMRFIENLLNPVNVPMFVYSIIKLLSPEEKKKLEEVYKSLIKREVKFIELDLDFNEKKEAEFIKESVVFWTEVKKEMLGIFEKMNANWDKKAEEGNKDYFG